MYGTSEYELVFKSKGERPKEIMYVRTLQALLFTLFLVLIYLEDWSAVFRVIQYFTIILNIIIILGNLRKSREISGINKSVLSYILIVVLFIFSALGEAEIENIILVFSSILYILTFAAVFLTTSDE